MLIYLQNKGVGFGIGAGALSMDVGQHLGNTSCSFSNKPQTDGKIF